MATNYIPFQTYFEWVEPDSRGRSPSGITVRPVQHPANHYAKPQAPPQALRPIFEKTYRLPKYQERVVEGGDVVKYGVDEMIRAALNSEGLTVIQERPLTGEKVAWFKVVDTDGARRAVFQLPFETLEKSRNVATRLQEKNLPVVEDWLPNLIGLLEVGAEDIEGFIQDYLEPGSESFVIRDPSVAAEADLEAAPDPRREAQRIQGLPKAEQGLLQISEWSKLLANDGVLLGIKKPSGASDVVYYLLR